MFVRLYHGPQNATLVLAGDLPTDVREQVERYFGRRQGGKRPPMPEFNLVTQSGERRVVRRSEFASNPALIVTWPSAPIYMAGDAEADVLGRVLEARLSTLAEQLAPGEIVWHDAHQYSHVGSSEFVVHIEGSSSSAPDRLLEVLDAALEELRQQPIPGEEIDYARRIMQLDIFHGLQSLENRAERMHTYVGAGKPPNWLEQDLARYDRVTAGTVARVLDTLVPELRIVLLTYPAEEPS